LTPRDVRIAFFCGQREYVTQYLFDNRFVV
jgi:hypothetical protein